MYCLKTLKRKELVLKTIPFFTIIYFLLLAVFAGNRIAKAAKLADGTWSQSASPGTTTVTFTNGATLLPANSDIVLTFPSTATVSQGGTNISVTGQSSPTRSNNTLDNTITINIDGTIDSSLAVTITMTDGLSAYVTTTYAQESLAINTLNATDQPVDFGVAIKTNSNTTTITASVPLFVNMAIDDTTMALGTLSTASVSQATQQYTINSNNQTGITMQIATDGDLDDASSNTINYVGDSTVSAGSEEYGIAVSTSGLTVDANYITGDNDIIEAANNIATSGGSVANATLDITYKASIAGTTVAGSYNQVVTVTIATIA
ncbi:hypothetical protein A2V49_03400 [candidate division WWE3 bacterium RBG_19FT_COMBO_34_6]|uniref:Uncharacterized protein n=1 Tax=candidate division WWE3 bacterium RBG_19FT_COMBO_34_6 TaxID=1802612 RepID=A0A1F4UKL6_UNCKA|nr:MAG: hypothetical protein A2V49_03400 [candidate division WWE3 bacterium RBG_19FT_COMBO_34_6]